MVSFEKCLRVAVIFTSGFSANHGILCIPFCVLFWAEEVVNLTDIGSNQTQKMTDMFYVIAGISIATFFCSIRAVFRSSKCLLALNLGMQLIMICAAIATVFMVKDFRTYDQGEFEKTLNEALTDKFYNLNISFQNSLHRYEPMYECCGVNGTRDYINRDFTGEESHGPIPYSCCVLGGLGMYDRKDGKGNKNIGKEEVVNLDGCFRDFRNNATTSEYLHVDGCYERISYSYLREIDVFFGYSIFLAGFNMISFLAASLLLLHLYELLPYKQQLPYKKMHDISQACAQKSTVIGTTEEEEESFI